MRNDKKCCGLFRFSDISLPDGPLYGALLDGVEPAGIGDVDGDGVISGADITALYSRLLE